MLDLYQPKLTPKLLVGCGQDGDTARGGAKCCISVETNTLRTIILVLHKLTVLLLVCSTPGPLLSLNFVPRSKEGLVMCITVIASETDDVSAISNIEVAILRNVGTPSVSGH